MFTSSLVEWRSYLTDEFLMVQSAQPTMPDHIAVQLPSTQTGGNNQTGKVSLSKIMALVRFISKK